MLASSCGNIKWGRAHRAHLGAAVSCNALLKSSALTLRAVKPALENSKWSVKRSGQSSVVLEKLSFELVRKFSMHLLAQKAPDNHVRLIVVWTQLSKEMQKLYRFDEPFARVALPILRKICSAASAGFYFNDEGGVE